MPPHPAPRRRRWPFAAAGLALGVAVFALGVVHLFQLRFSLGDVYPPYSTLRTDPLGAKAFFEALAAQPALSVERNLRPLDLLGKTPLAAPARDAADDPALAVFYLGADAYEWPFFLHGPDADRLETIMRRGGRVVVTFLPVSTPLTARRLELARREAEPASPTPRAKGSPASTPAPKPTPIPPTPFRRRDNAAVPPDLIPRWQVDFLRAGARDKPGVPTLRASPIAAAGVPTDPVALSWHSAASFDLAPATARGAGWTALYVCDGRPVIVARPFGNRGGELILASDSYFLSNEALRAEPHPALLAAMTGPCRRVSFDESHLGIHENPGLMTLARRYRLQGAVAALALLAALFVWKNTVSLVPPSITDAGESSDGAPPTVAGRDSAAGFLNLLRRGVPARDLSAVCLAQWERAHTAGPDAPPPGKLERLRALAQEDAARPARQRSPAATYRAMCAALRGPSKK